MEWPIQLSSANKQLCLRKLRYFLLYIIDFVTQIIKIYTSLARLSSGSISEEIIVIDNSLRVVRSYPAWVFGSIFKNIKLHISPVMGIVIYLQLGKIKAFRYIHTYVCAYFELCVIIRYFYLANFIDRA
jgi:hypothetical protein